MSNHTYFDWGHFFNFLRFLGLAPYEKTKMGDYNVSKIFQFYSLMIALLVSIYFYFGYEMIKGYVDGENLLSITFILLDILGFTFASIFCILATVYKSAQLSFLVNKIIKTNKNVNKLFTFEIKNRHGLGIFIYSAIQNLSYIGYFVMYVISVKSSNLVYYLKCLLSFLTGLIFVASDINFLIFLNNSFIIFNKINYIIYSKKNLRMKNLKKTYLKACDIVDLINKCFSKMLLVLVVIEFSGLVFIVYFNNKHDSKGFSFAPIFWFLTYILKLLVKVVNGRSVKIEVKYKKEIWPFNEKFNNKILEVVFEFI